MKIYVDDHNAKVVLDFKDSKCDTFTSITDEYVKENLPCEVPVLYDLHIINIESYYLGITLSKFNNVIFNNVNLVILTWNSQSSKTRIHIFDSYVIECNIYTQTKSINAIDTIIKQLDGLYTERLMLSNSEVHTNTLFCPKNEIYIDYNSSRAIKESNYSIEDTNPILTAKCSGSMKVQLDNINTNVIISYILKYTV